MAKDKEKQEAGWLRLMALADCKAVTGTPAAREQEADCCWLKLLEDCGTMTVCVTAEWTVMACWLETSGTTGC